MRRSARAREGSRQPQDAEARTWGGRDGQGTLTRTTGALIALALLSSTRALAAAPAPFVDASQLLPPDPCVGSCEAHAVTLVDLDGDGALDIILARGGDLYDIGDAAPPRYLHQSADGTFTDVTTASFGDFSSRVRDVAIGDIDGNGLLDVLFPGSFGVDSARLFLQVAPGAFEARPDLLPLGFSSTVSAARFGDFDGDGDLDLVVADWGASPGGFQTGDPSPANVRLYWNLGGGSLVAALPETLPPASPATVASVPTDIDLLDIDGNWGLDVLITMRNGLTRLFYNKGDGTFGEAAVPPKRGPYSLHADACDIDTDGDLDLVIDDAAANVGTTHRTQILSNDGAGDLYDLSGGAVLAEANTNQRDVKCADVDGDGDVDLLIATANLPADEVLLNDGTGVFRVAPGLFPPRPGRTTALAVGDVDGDGRLDVATTSDESSPRVLRLLLSATTVDPDVTPPHLRGGEYAAAVAGSPIPVRVAAWDAYPAEIGQALRSVTLTWDVGDGPAPLTARFVGGDLWRAVVPPQAEGATVTLTAKAVDRSGLSTTIGPWMISVAAAPPTGGAGGEGGGGGSTDMGGTDAMGQGGGDAGGAGGEGEPPPVASSRSGGGCGVGASPTAIPWLGGALAFLLIARRRRSN